MNEQKSRSLLPSDFKKTNVRLPRSIHAELKRASADRDQSIEQIVLAAVERELGTSKSPEPRHVTAESRILERTLEELKRQVAWIEQESRKASLFVSSKLETELFAVQFLECLPISVLIKDAKARIVWSNRACEMLLQETRSSLEGRTIQELLGLSPDDPALYRFESIKTKKVDISCEFMKIKGREVWLTVYRFLFSVNKRDYVGDLSFVQRDLEMADSVPVLLQSWNGTFSSNTRDLLAEDVTALLVAFLEKLPNVAVLKSADERIKWCNPPFLKLAHLKDPIEAVGRTSAEIFCLPENHETHRYDWRAAVEGIATLGKETLRGADRIAVHFPIFGRDGLEFIGVVSSEANEVLELREGHYRWSTKKFILKRSWTALTRYASRFPTL